MSWASKSKTSRVEELAYCLSGILDVKMPLLYGEGERAFTRLHEKIIKISADEPIFFWSVDSPQRELLLIKKLWSQIQNSMDDTSMYFWPSKV
jgi:hypothetical protein